MYLLFQEISGKKFYYDKVRRYFVERESASPFNSLNELYDIAKNIFRHYDGINDLGAEYISYTVHVNISDKKYTLSDTWYYKEEADKVCAILNSGLNKTVFVASENLVLIPPASLVRGSIFKES
jgi:hypothetical protein